MNADAAEQIAASVADVIGATRKFLFFLQKYLPDPPRERPEEYDQVDWTALPEILRMIYGYRSKALHEGRPFPAPMCESPHLFEHGVPIERPMGLSSASNNSSWMRKECPMLLATFEYIVQGALVAWWKDSPAPREE